MELKKEKKKPHVSQQNINLTSSILDMYTARLLH